MQKYVELHRTESVCIAKEKGQKREKAKYRLGENICKLWVLKEINIQIRYFGAGL
jgi:hypothetical protein